MAFLIYPGVASFDVGGPAAALASAGRQTSAPGHGGYKVTMVSLAGGIIESGCPGLSFDSVSSASFDGPLDTLFILGGRDAPQAARDRALIKEIQRLAKKADRIACICTGAFLAAEAGLLTGRRAATHWLFCDIFSERYPDVRLDREVIWLRDGAIWSSAGVSAGVDLTLAIIEHDLGKSVALRVARELVVYLKRSGGQSQFSTVLSGQISDESGSFGQLFEWMSSNLASDLSVELLAQKAGMSPRNFARSFASKTGLTPARAVEMMRTQVARDSIETTETPLAAIAKRTGFGDVQRMRRAFMRQFDLTPADIRERRSAVEPANAS